MTSVVRGFRDEGRLHQAVFKLRRAFGFNEDLPDVRIYATEEGQTNPFFEKDKQGKDVPVKFDPQDPQFADMNAGDWQILRQAKMLNRFGQGEGKLYALNPNNQTQAGMPFGVDLARINQYEQAKEAIMLQLGHNPTSLYLKDLNDAYRTIRNVSVWGRMSLSWATNMSQPANTIRWVGFTDFAKGVKSLFNKMDREWAASTGGLINEMTDWYAGGGFRADTLLKRLTPFHAVEMFNRETAVLAGKHYLVHATKQLIRDGENREAIERFTELGFDSKTDVLDVLSNNYSELEVDQAARIPHQELSARLKPLGKLIMAGAKRVSDKTQHKVEPIDLPPLYYRSPLGRLVTQFMTFTQKQSEFTKNALMRDLKSLQRGQGVGRMLEGLIGAFGFGYVSLLVAATFRGNYDDKDFQLKLETVTRAINRTAALGLISHIWEAKDIPGALGGTFAVRGLGIAEQVIRKPSSIIGLTPVVGRPIQNLAPEMMEQMQGQGTALEQIRRRGRPNRPKRPQPPSGYQRPASNQ